MFVIDPHFADPDKVGLNRYRFLLEALTVRDVTRAETETVARGREAWRDGIDRVEGG